MRTVLLGPPPASREFRRLSRHQNVSPDKESEGWGHVWTWTAIDAARLKCKPELVIQPPFLDSECDIAIPLAISHWDTKWEVPLPTPT
jgi:hypothetical protein